MFNVDNIPVRMRNGVPISTQNSNHVPAGTPNRNNAATRLFFLLLAPPQPAIVARNDTSSTGWAMYSGNAACPNVGIGGRRRCWELREGGIPKNRIIYSGNSGEFFLQTL